MEQYTVLKTSWKTETNKLWPIKNYIQCSGIQEMLVLLFFLRKKKNIISYNYIQEICFSFCISVWEDYNSEKNIKQMQYLMDSWFSHIN